jgi:hypothetical protein
MFVISAMGLFGEIAAGARYWALCLTLDFTVGGDGGDDLEAWGLTWQIKTSSMSKLIFNGLDDFSK